MASVIRRAFACLDKLPCFISDVFRPRPLLRHGPLFQPGRLDFVRGVDEADPVCTLKRLNMKIIAGLAAALGAVAHARS